MKEKSITLIGFRATGKSLVGAILAQRLGWEFVDMDSELTAVFGMEISEWVSLHGWDAFRAAETRVLETLGDRERLVLSTGGGVVLSAENREFLRTHFFVVWLKASVETILTRLAGDPATGTNRPPLTDLPLRQEIEQVLQERSPLYEEAADMVLNADEASPEALINRILSRLFPGGGTMGT